MDAVPQTAIRIPGVCFAFVNNGGACVVIEHTAGPIVEERHRVAGEYPKSDVATVAPAIVHLIQLRLHVDVPPEPVGGGRINHDSFYDQESDVEYPSVKLLQRYNNVNIGFAVEDRVGFTAEEKLFPRPSDLDPIISSMDNHGDGMLIAIDSFGSTCSLLKSFIAFAPSDDRLFIQKLASVVQYPDSYAKNILGMKYAQSRLVISPVTCPPSLPLRVETSLIGFIKSSRQLFSEIAFSFKGYVVHSKVVQQTRMNKVVARW
ncbi:hypothetical protein FRB95_003475 [Tulasnella sp. JGI-2019a]|nr:hypothetical protein FRB95_003475 [Tulasnella sp. JGI-2019a]